MHSDASWARVRRCIAGAHRHAGSGHDPCYVAIPCPRPSAGVVTAGGVSIGLVGHTRPGHSRTRRGPADIRVAVLALKLAGAAYLIYLGIGLLRTRQSSLPIGGQAARTLGRLFVDAAVSNLSNPKSRSSTLPSCRNSSRPSAHIRRSRCSSSGSHLLGDVCR